MIKIFIVIPTVACPAVFPIRHKKLETKNKSYATKNRKQCFPSKLSSWRQFDSAIFHLLCTNYISFPTTIFTAILFNSLHLDNKQQNNLCLLFF